MDLIECHQIKKQKLEFYGFNKIYKRDSFDRFGDDLCELILSYFSIESCFLLECLSKQIKNLIFKKQQKIIITTENFSLMWINNYMDYFNSNVLHLKKRESLTIDVLENILKKCKYVDDIYIDNTFKYIKRFDYKTIANCQNLKVLNLNHELTRVVLPKKNWIIFNKNLSCSLRVIKFNKTYQPLEKLLKCCPKVTAIYGLETDDLRSFIDENKKPVLIYLQSIELKLHTIETFNCFVGSYFDKIMILKLSIESLFFEYETIKIKLISTIANFIHAKEIELKIILEESKKKQILINKLEPIFLNCKDLKSFSITLRKSIFKANILVTFPAIKSSIEKLQLCDCKSNITSLQSVIFDKLSYLSLDMEDLNDSYIQELNLFNLKYLKLMNSNKITDNVFKYMYKLNNLKKVLISSSEELGKVSQSELSRKLIYNPSLSKMELRFNEIISKNTFQDFLRQISKNSGKLHKIVCYRKFQHFHKNL